MEWLGVDRRRLGTGLLVFGVVGMVLAAIIAVGLVGGAIAARNLDDRVTADQAQLVGVLDHLTVTIDHLATSTDNAAQTLVTTKVMVTEAQQVLADLATAADQLGGALDVSVLGQQPFSGAASALRSLSDEVEVFANQLTTLAADLDMNASDMSEVAGQVRQIGSDVAAVTARVSAFDRTAEIINLLVGGILLGGLLVAWVGLAAAFCTWVGWRLRRLPDADADEGSITGASPGSQP